MLCPTCGQETIDGAFCIHCGASVVQSSPAEPATQQEEAFYEPEEPVQEESPPTLDDFTQSIPNPAPVFTPPQSAAQGYTPPRETVPAYNPSRYQVYGVPPEPSAPQDAYRPMSGHEETMRPKLTVQEAPRPLSVKRFFWIELVSWIPVLNIIVLCCIALSNHSNPNAVRLAQAKLTVMMLLLTLLLAGAAVVMLLIAGDVIDGIYLGRWRLG